MKRYLVLVCFILGCGGASIPPNSIISPSTLNARWAKRESNEAIEKRKVPLANQIQSAIQLLEKEIKFSAEDGRRSAGLGIENDLVRQAVADEFRNRGFSLEVKENLIIRVYWD